MALSTKSNRSLTFLMLTLAVAPLLVLFIACSERHTGVTWEEETEMEIEEVLDWQSRVYWVPGVSEVKIGVMPAPIGPKIELEAAAWKADNVSMMVSMLPDNEIITLGLEEEEQACLDVGIQFFHFPVPDFNIPASPEDLNLLCNEIIEGLAEDKGVVFHCRGGIGRAPTVAACLLVKLGYSPDDAFSKISAARGITTPETAQQLQFVHDFQDEYGD